jgi:hypothetical protein
MPRRNTRLRDVVARLPRGTLSLLVATCLLLAAVSIVWARTTGDSLPARSSGPVFSSAAFAGAAARSPRILSVDLIDCEPVESAAPDATRPLVGGGKEP